MAGTGAPEGNTYAAKGGRGTTISLYLSYEDMQTIEHILQERGEDSSKQACVTLAKNAAKSGVYQLVIAKKSETHTTLLEEMRATVDRLFAMARIPTVTTGDE